MKKPIALLILMIGFITTRAQSPKNDSIFLSRVNNYSADSFRLRTPGTRISLYSFCNPHNNYGRAVYFRKDQDSAIHRVTLHNLKIALADNPASMEQLRIAGANVYIGIGLLAGGLALTAAGIITSVHHNHDLSNAYDQASAKWFAQAQANPGNPNNPMPTLPHYSGPTALFYIGAAMSLSCMIPLFNVNSHAKKAIDLYNGVN